MPTVDGWKLPPTPKNIELLDSQKIALRIGKRKTHLEFAESELSLVSPGYTQPGPFKSRPWQREVIDASLYWDRIFLAMATQMGKSLCVDLPAYHYMVLGINGMVAYANSKTVEDVFKLRLSEMIRSVGDFKNPALRELWSGKDDDLTIQNFRLRNCLWRIASAQNKNDMASFSAGIAIGSEVAKWERQRWNPVRMLEGRQGAYEGTTSMKLFLESSPFEEGDYLYREVFKSGTIILQPHHKCPHCGCYQVLVDSQIKLRDEKASHEPARIRELGEAAVYYQCVNCRQEITEEERLAADEHVIWAAPCIEVEGFRQEAETIYPDGTIPTRLDGGKRKGYDAVCYNASRLVNVHFKFWQCLARFFECKNDPEDKKVYDNETMARWTRKKTERVEVRYLESKKSSYRQYGDTRSIPDDVLILTYGGDTQGDGFYQSWYGWGYMMSCYLIKQEFVECSENDYKDPRDVYVKFMQGLYQEQPLWANGMPADFRLGFQDRGGHRAKDVDFICERIPNVKAYVGLTKLNDKMPLAYKSENGPFFLGQTETLSANTSTIMLSEDFFLPEDVTPEYMAQIVRQFIIRKVTPEGAVYTKWVHGYQGDDHYRDCFNYAYAAARYLNLDKILFDRAQCDLLRDNRERLCVKDHSIKKEPTEDSILQTTPQRIARGRGGYFGRALGGPAR